LVSKLSMHAVQPHHLDVGERAHPADDFERIPQSPSGNAQLSTEIGDSDAVVFAFEDKGLGAIDKSRL
jgi:hypothetical protein